MKVVPEYREQYADWLIGRIDPTTRDKALEMSPVYAVDDDGVVYLQREDGETWAPEDNRAQRLTLLAGHRIDPDAPFRCGACFGMTWVVFAGGECCDPYPMRCAQCGKAD